MKKRTPISKIMSKDILSVNSTQSLKDVADLIAENNIRHVPVVSGEEVIGLISKTDLQRISFVNSAEANNLSTSIYELFKIEQVMTKDLVSVQQSDIIYDVAIILSKNEFHALPVLEGKKLVGIVTSTDLIKYLIDQF